MTADALFEPSSIPGHLAPTPQRFERLLSKQPLEELYEVEEQPFARGKYATVRRCRERSSGRQWAAKFLRKRRRAQELRAEALHEVAVLDAAAHCPRLVSLHQVFETNTEMILILELAPGGELQMILDRDEVPEERQVARLLMQILQGIEFLHSLNVAHLDIKPQNLVLTGQFPDCDVKLCDFGISRYIGENADIREILGTPDYVAPEVLNYEPISLATDMWSVGVLLYVLLTGCSPFGGDTKQETFCNIGRCRLDFPDDLFEDISEEARDLMRKLMLKDPEERLTVTECLQHSWFGIFQEPSRPLSVSAPVIMVDPVDPLDFNKDSKEEGGGETESQETDSGAQNKTNVARATSSHTDNNILALTPERRDTFRRNMESLAQKFSARTEFLIIEPTDSVSGAGTMTQRRATGMHTMPIGELFKCNPMFVLQGEEQQCSSGGDSGSDSVSEVSTDSSSDRSSIYSDDSLDFILYGKSQSRGSAGGFPLPLPLPLPLSFPFVNESSADRWEQQQRRHHQRYSMGIASKSSSSASTWPRECNGIVSKALSRFTSTENHSSNGRLAKITSSSLSSKSSSPSPSPSPSPSTSPANIAIHAKANLEALREREGNFVVIREPVRAGRYTRYSEVQCESVQARIRRFQIHGTS